MLKAKVYKGPTSEFQWALFNDQNVIVATSPFTYTTERNLLADLKNFLKEIRQPVCLIGYQMPLMAKNTPEL